MSGFLNVVFLSAAGACCGAVVGSFLNVVIHRLPRLIDSHDGRITAAQYVSCLSWPPSHCPGCQHQLELRDNVPILSYFGLRGRCRFCRQPYGLRYLVVELLTAAAFAYCVAMLGLTPKAFLTALFFAGLMSLTIIDVEEQLLPDAVLAPLLCLGLIFNSLYGGGIFAALLGAAAGYSVLWFIRTCYRLYAGIEGLGYGDIKFASVLGAWVGAGSIPAMFAIAFVTGVVAILPFSLSGRIEKQAAIPFGPFLALGGFCAFVLPSLTAMTARAFFRS